MHCGLLRRIIFFKAVGQAMVQAVRRAGLFQILLSKPRCYAITLLGQTECTFWIKYLQWAFHVFSIFPKCNFFLLRNSLWFYIRIFAAELPNYSINKLNLFLWPLYLFVLECNLVGEFLQFIIFMNHYVSLSFVCLFQNIHLKIFVTEFIIHLKTFMHDKRESYPF